MDLVAIIMSLIMIHNVKRKYTAVGRKEMVLFFYVYLLNVILDILLISNVITGTTGVYKVMNVEPGWQAKVH